MKMKIARKMMFAFVLVGLWQLSQQTVTADNPCQQGCTASYQLCLADASDNYDQCEQDAEWARFSCDSAAYSAYTDCWNTCQTHFPGWTGCEEHCNSHLQPALEQCLNNYGTAEAQCYNAQQGANQSCENNYTACYNNCLP